MSIECTRNVPAGLSDLISVSTRLSEAGVVHALDGTGLLYCLGFDVSPRDWDLFTDAPHRMNRSRMHLTGNL